MILKAGTYRFNNNPILLDEFTDFNVNFSSNGNSYIGMRVYKYGIYYVPDFSKPVGEWAFAYHTDHGGWSASNTSYQHIIFDEDTEVDDTFGSWYISNTNYNEVNASALVTIEYNGSTIAELNAGETATLSCEGKKMVSDLSVKIESGYVKPSGSVTITENSTVDVTDKEEVIVNVPTYLTVSTEDEALDETTIPIVEGQIIIVEG